MKATILAIDLAKSSQWVFGTNERGSQIFHRKVSRENLFEFVVTHGSGARVVMESCGTSHYWGRRFQEAGFEVQLIPPQHVAPFRRGQKNDKNDAVAIATAASRADMCFVGIKPVELQEVQSYHRVRERLVGARTKIMNEMRGLLAEFGVVIAKSERALREKLAELNACPIPESIRLLMANLAEELNLTEDKIREITKFLSRKASTEVQCKRLMSIPGIGEITATALYAKGNHHQFKKGRQFAASYGVVPRQDSTGGKAKLGHITKRGDKYIRKLVVHGARSVIRTAHKRDDTYSQWVVRVYEKHGYCKAAVALANRNLRIVWAILSSEDKTFDSNFIPAQFRKKAA